MRHYHFQGLGIPLTLLLAMGNWGNTPSPPLDSGAPDPVGNDGQLVLEIDGESTTFLVQSAHLSGATLTIEGETVGGKPQFHLVLDFADAPQDLKRATLAVSPGSRTVDLAGQDCEISGGSVQITRASGSGPWEVDGEVNLDTAIGPISGTLEARVRA